MTTYEPNDIVTEDEAREMWRLDDEQEQWDREVVELAETIEID